MGRSASKFVEKFKNRTLEKHKGAAPALCR
jgi:hypothetical protein